MKTRVGKTNFGSRTQLAILVALCSAPLQSQGQGSLQITFNGSPPQPPGTSFFIEQYFESGMWFRPLGAIGPGNGFSHRRGGGTISSVPDNGSAYLAAALGDSLAFSFTDSTVFSLVAVDLAEYSTILPEAVAVPFIGYRFDGSTVTASLTTDGIIDGAGPLADFQTFNFGPEWSGLSRVEIPTALWSLDNLVVSIPEPGTWALLVLGGALAGWRFWKRRPKH